MAKFTPSVLSRRDFVSLSALAAVATAVQLTSGRLSAATPALSPGRKIPVGIELYSVRTELAKDLPGTLKAIAAMGYEAVEFYSPYFEWTPAFAKTVRTLMNDLGLRCHSTHNHIESFTPGAGLEKAAELNHILGSSLLVLAMAPRGTEGLDGWKTLSGKLAAASATLETHGLTAGYHNHQAEWKTLEGGGRVMDVLAANTPKTFVLQFDVGTCLEAGADPVAWIRANPGRIKSVHLKDWAPGSEKDEKGYRVLFGEGTPLWPQITAALEADGGVECYLLEQEGSRFSEFETARRCLENWKAFRAGK